MNDADNAERPLGRAIRVAYVTTYDAGDVHAWSGTVYAMAQCLKRAGFELTCIGNLAWSHAAWLRAKQVWHRLLGKHHLRDREPVLTKSFARQVSERLNDSEVDIVVSPGAIPIGYLDTRLPVVFWTDTTFAGALDYNPPFSNLSNATVCNGHLLDQNALDRCRLALFTSEWAAKTAIREYRIDPGKVHVIPFGANIEAPPTTAEVMEAIRTRDTNHCHLIFVGVNWKHKGGDIAVAAAAMLNAMGLTTTLHVVGCIPPGKPPPFVQTHGFVSKREEAGRKRLAALYSKAHFLILPTRAECVANVFAEACCYGLPILATDTGGVATAVLNDVNGHVFPYADRGAGYAEYVVHVWSNPDKYRALSAGARNLYETKLNWQSAGERFKELVTEFFLAPS